jgi:pantetheine-phosphate adenylyltransferase
VALGGTFDAFHLGHKRIIDAAFELGDRVLLGLTTERMLRANPKNHVTSSYATRRDELVAYLRDREFLSRAEVLPIDNSYGPTLRDEAVEALIVSSNTAPRAAEINRLRVAKGLKPLDIVVTETVLAANGLPISTSRIRQETIDRNGQLRVTTQKSAQ